MKLSGWWKYMYQKQIRRLASALIFGILVIFLVSRPDDSLFTTNSRQLLSFSFQQIQEVETTCTPKKHIFFLKTHKCASSTIQNIFLRYGYKNNLTFALPTKGNYLGNPNQFRTSMLPPSLVPSNGLIDIFCLHSRLKASEQKKVLYEDAAWITVLREPVTLFESLFSFFHLKNFYNIQLKNFPKVPFSKLQEIKRTKSKFGKNQMLFDLGYDENMNESEVKQAIETLDSLFDLVMIAEKLDESLVLLRHQLCWQKEDIIYFTKNARQNRFKPTLSNSSKETILKLNRPDKLLYDHFFAKHELSVAAFGHKRMKEEVAELKALRQEAYEGCLVTEVNGKDSSLKFPEYSNMVSAYAISDVNDTSCLLLTYPELAFIDVIRKKQSQSLKNNHFEKPAQIPPHIKKKKT